MLHFLTRLARSATEDEETKAPASIVRLWPAIAIGAIFIPWLLYPAVGNPLDTASVATLWDGLWPLVIGAALALALRRWEARLPRVPEGDRSSRQRRRSRRAFPGARSSRGSTRGWAGRLPACRFWRSPSLWPQWSVMEVRGRPVPYCHVQLHSRTDARALTPRTVFLFVIGANCCINVPMGIIRGMM